MYNCLPAGSRRFMFLATEAMMDLRRPNRCHDPYTMMAPMMRMMRMILVVQLMENGWEWMEKRR